MLLAVLGYLLPRYSLDVEIYPTMSLLVLFAHNPNELSHLHKALSSPKKQEGTDSQARRHSAVMVKGPLLNSSVLVEDYFSSPQCLYQQSAVITSTPCKEANLFYQDNKFAWKGCLKSLKNLFAKSSANLHGNWTSPGGEVKLFTSKDYTIKWQGRARQKLAVTRDDERGNLT